MKALCLTGTRTVTHTGGLKHKLMMNKLNKILKAYIEKQARHFENDYILCK